MKAAINDERAVINILRFLLMASYQSRWDGIGSELAAQPHHAHHSGGGGVEWRVHRCHNTLTDFRGRTSGPRHSFWTGVHTQHL